MASGTSSNIQREASLRRIAIVLSSLPPATAAKLMGTIEPESKRAVRRTMASLADVDPLERKRAIHSFKVSLTRNPAGFPSNSAGDEVAISADAENRTANGGGASRVVSSSQIQANEDSPLAGTAHASLSFLADVDDESLIRLLSSEHPQAIAMVLASMAPSHAARVLPRLEPGLQSQALSRIGRLGNVSKEAVGDVAEHLKKRVAGMNEERGNSNDPVGKQALDAILAAMPSSSRTVVEPQTSENSPSATQHVNDPAIDLSRKLRDAELETPKHQSPVTEQARHETESAELRLIDEDGNATAVDAALSLGRVSESAGPSHKHLQSTDSIHAFLLGLDPAELCQALGKVDTRTAMLALCGLPPDTSNAVLAVLPKTTARKVRIKMTTLGSLHLREIDEAKEVIARTLLGVDATASASVGQSVPMAA